MHPKSKKKTIAVNTEQLAYTFTKVGDKQRQRYILIDISSST